jgi:nucleotidyltransferase/DNA polymerase involved in DNA repair
MPGADLREATLRRLQASPQQIRAIFAEFTPLIEPLSLHEAYLDATENLPGMQLATEIAREIRAKIKAITELNASARDLLHRSVQS